jgi:transposase
MRRGMNGLALQVQETLGRDPFAGDLFVFRGQRGNFTSFNIPIAVCGDRVPLASAIREAASPRSAHWPSRP